ncbi:MAG: insulinase family protein [Thermoclostridium sp.]|nr:insulinase family protein [Thermoclostridium sp.]
MKTLEFDRIREKVIQVDHPSGLKVFVIPKKGYHKVYATFATNYGSIDNTFIAPGETEQTRVPDGIAHFLEHKLFEQEDGSVMDKFSKLGSEPNAYTDFTQTVYLFSCTDGFEENFRLLMHYVQHPYLTDENVEKEKGIIAQEIKMYQDNADWRVFFNLLGAMYEKHPVKIDIAGTVDSISQITKETLYKCYNTFYHPSNMILVVVGDVDPDTVFKMADDNIIARDNPGNIQKIFPEETHGHKSQLVERKLAVAMPQFQMGIRDKSGMTGYELPRRKICLEIMLSMLMGRSSLLYNQLYNEGLINQSFGADATLEESYGFTAWGGQSNDPVRCAQRISEAIQKVQQEGLARNQFDRIRKAHEGRFIRSLNSPENISQAFIPLAFKGTNYFEFARVYAELTLADVEKVFQEHFALEPVLSIIWPSGSQDKNG